MTSGTINEIDHVQICIFCARIWATMHGMIFLGILLFTSSRVGLPIMSNKSEIKYFVIKYYTCGNLTNHKNPKRESMFKLPGLFPPNNSVPGFLCRHWHTKWS